MSIAWIKNILVDGEQTSLHIQLGNYCISDKCYAKVGTGKEHWFTPLKFSRQDIMNQGIKIIEKELEGKELTYGGGEPFDLKQFTTDSNDI